MAKIDTSAWKEFRVGDLFDIHPTATYKMTNAQLMDDGDNPVVVNSSYNNGVGGFTSQETTEMGNRITFSDTTTADAVFYQPDAFVGYPHVQGMYPKGKYEDMWQEKRLLFFSTSFKKAASICGFDYAYKFTREIAATMDVLLPVDADGNPDWVYMDEYMSEVMQEAEASLENLSHADGDKHAVDVSDWREFVIGDLFDVVKGTRLTKAHMVPGETRFIGSSAMNNGCTAMVGNKDNVHPSNTITVCYNGSVGETFYQDEPFLASDDVNVLYPKFDMNREIALFIAPLIKAISARYNYIDKWKQEVMVKDKIMLPVDADGNPDWAYMDEYMSQMMQVSGDALSELGCVGGHNV